MSQSSLHTYIHVAIAAAPGREGVESSMWPRTALSGRQTLQHRHCQQPAPARHATPTAGQEAAPRTPPARPTSWHTPKMAVLLFVQGAVGQGQGVAVHDDTHTHAASGRTSAARTSSGSKRASCCSCVTCVCSGVPLSCTSWEGGAIQGGGGKHGDSAVRCRAVPAAQTLAMLVAVRGQQAATASQCHSCSAAESRLPSWQGSAWHRQEPSAGDQNNTAQSCTARPGGSAVATDLQHSCFVIILLRRCNVPLAFTNRLTGTTAGATECRHGPAAMDAVPPHLQLIAYAHAFYSSLFQSNSDESGSKCRRHSAASCC